MCLAPRLHERTALLELSQRRGMEPHHGTIRREPLEALRSLPTPLDDETSLPMEGGHQMQQRRGRYASEAI